MKKLWIDQIESDYIIWKNLLNELDLRTEKILDETYGYFDGENLVATGSIFENIIKCVAIKKEFQGGAIFNELISSLINKIYENGYEDVYLYTKPDSATAFSYLGFKKIEDVDDKLTFMEKSNKGFETYLENLRNSISGESKTRGAIVMNANPFTKGHLYLVEYAKNRCDELHIFLVSENKSVFDYNTRLKLVKKGTSHLENIYIHPTESYMISSQTFPSYFLKEDSDIISIQATLDSKIFKNHIAKALKIDMRFMGEEPFSEPTRIYNQAMEKVFSEEPNPNYPQLIIINRLDTDGEIISASTVRNLIAMDKLSEIKRFVPKTTFEFLNSEEAQGIIKALKEDPLKGLKKSEVKNPS